MFSFEKTEKINNPFTHVVIESPLRSADLDKVLNGFPTEQEFSQFENVMGGRRRLSSDDPEFYSFLQKSESWREFIYIGITVDNRKAWNNSMDS